MPSQTRYSSSAAVIHTLAFAGGCSQSIAAANSATEDHHAPDNLQKKENIAENEVPDYIYPIQRQFMDSIIIIILHLDKFYSTIIPCGGFQITMG